MAERITDIWVSNYGSDNISVLDAENSYAKTDYAGLEFSTPIGVCVDSQGNIWTCNPGDNSVSKYDASNGYARTDYTDVGSYTLGIAVDPDDNIWVTSRYSDQVIKMDASNNYATTAYSAGTSPHKICIDGVGNIYVSNYDNSMMTKLTKSSNYSAESYFSGGYNPLGIAVDQDGNVWTANYNQEGEFGTVSMYPPPSYEDSYLTRVTISTGYPRALAVDSWGNIWVTVTDNTVKKLTKASGYSMTSYAVGNDPRGVAVDANNNIWVANYASGTVSKLDASNGYAKTDYAVGTSPQAYGDMTGQIPYILNFGGVWGGPKAQTFQADTSRELFFTESQTFQADTDRQKLAVQTIQTDTVRILNMAQTFQSDTIRKLAATPSGYESITAQMQSKRFMDKFTIVTRQSVVIGQNVVGNLMGMPFRFVVEKTSKTNGKITATGVYDIDELLNKPISFSTSGSAVATMQAMAAALGKTLHIAIDDHIAVAIDESKPTFRDVLTHYFGWTDQVPHRQVNVFLRMNDLYVLQRGKESTVIDIVEYKNVTEDEEIIRTLQNSTDTDGNIVAGTISGASSTSAPIYLSGTISHGGDSYTYTNGLVVFESHTVDGKTTTTDYDYSSYTPPAYLTVKTVTTEEGSVVTDYDYNGGYLSRATETQYDTNNYVQMTRVTIYTPKGQGFWSVDIYEDGAYVSGGLQKGEPPGLADAYSIGYYSTSNRHGSGSGCQSGTSGRYIGDMFFPVSDQGTLDTIAAALEWLNGRKQQKISIDVFDPMVLDFTARYRWQGKEYYLESNTPERRPRSRVQRIQLVRWE